MAKKRTGVRTETGVLVKSKFEKRVADKLTSKNVRYIYEKGLKMEYVVPQTEHTYTPDFQLRGRTWYLETKGVLDAETRKRMLHVKASNPDKDIRFCFQRDNPIYKGSKTKYSDWATRNGFRWCIGEVPDTWLEED